MLVLMRGISGSGKSTFVSHLKEVEPALVHCSADFAMVGEDGVYRFDFKKLSAGHGNCFRTAVEALQRGTKLIVVDNTNTQLFELAPYILAAQAYQSHISIVRLDCAVEVAAARNLHGVPLASVEGMAKRMDKLLPFWPKEHVFNNPTGAEVKGWY